MCEREKNRVRKIVKREMKKMKTKKEQRGRGRSGGGEEMIEEKRERARLVLAHLGRP